MRARSPVRGSASLPDFISALSSPRTPFRASFRPVDSSASPELSRLGSLGMFRAGSVSPRRDILVVGYRGAFKGRQRVRAKG